MTPNATSSNPRSDVPGDMPGDIVRSAPRYPGLLPALASLALLALALALWEWASRRLGLPDAAMHAGRQRPLPAQALRPPRGQRHTVKLTRQHEERLTSCIKFLLGFGQPYRLHYETNLLVLVMVNVTMLKLVLLSGRNCTNQGLHTHVDHLCGCILPDFQRVVASGLE
jgi:hypothetical protein